MVLKRGTELKKWIDLSGLPIDEQTGHINWIQSVGTILSFQYCDVIGQIEILEYIKQDRTKLKILIKTPDMEREYNIAPASLKECSLHYALLQPISETHPHLVDFFLDKNDAFVYTANSGFSTKFICPSCRTIKSQRIEDFITNGFSCNECGDGVSYPEKLLFNIFRQLKIDFLYQITKSTPGFEWINGRYRYDFYITHNGQQFFIELDGRFHECDSVCLDNDNYKDVMAYKHGIKMIRIDCNYSSFKERFNFVKLNIQQSELSQIVPLDLVNWEDAHKKALQSKVVTAAQLWENDNLCLSEIANIIGVSQNTIREYLKIGTKLNLCHYNNDEIKKRNFNRLGKRAIRGAKKQVALFKNNILIGVFFSASELEKVSDKLLGVHCASSSIASVCTGRRQHCYGYTMHYISYEEYEQYEAQFSEQYKINEKGEVIYEATA